MSSLNLGTGPDGRFRGEKVAGNFRGIGGRHGHTRTVEETAPAGLIDTPALQHFLRRSPADAAPGPCLADDHVENRSFLDTTATNGANGVAEEARSAPVPASLHAQAIDPSGFKRSSILANRLSLKQRPLLFKD